MMLSALYRRLRGEDGFTVLELVVAATVMLISMLALGYTATLGFTDAAFSRQRQSAAGLAGQAIEQIRALPFDTVKKGLSTNDSTLSTDANVTTCGSAKCYGGEQMPTSGYASGTQITPLVPHTQQVTVGPTQYTVNVYVTYFNNIVDQNTYRVTSVVTWAATNARKGARHNVKLSTVVYSPSGCLSTATHPFAAPCQPFLYGQGSSGQGGATVTGTVDGLTFDRASLWLPGESVNQQIEQISSVQGHAWTGGVSLVRSAGGDEEYSGRQAVASGADNDPSTPGNEYDTHSTPSQSAVETLSVEGEGNSLTLVGPAGDTATTTSTTSATASYACPSSAATNQLDALPCGASKSLQVGTSSITLGLNGHSLDLGAMNLVTLGPPAATSPGYAFVNRDVLQETLMCPSTSGDGCVHVDVQRTLGTLTLGGLPDTISAPAGWEGYLVQVTGLADSVSAESGLGSAAPSATASGTISFWNGTGYTTCAVTAVACLGAGGLFPVADLNLEDQALPGGLDVVMHAALAPGTTNVTQTTAACTPACPNTRTMAQAISPSPVAGEFHLEVSMGGDQLCDLTIDVDFGTVVAKASYQQSPGG